jgi:hypothetical protein
MKLIQATVTKAPREVTTKYGDRVVLDCVTHAGEQVTVWHKAGDREVLGRCPNERVTLAVDSKGKYSVIEHAQAHVSSVSHPEPNTNTSKADDIRDYTQKLAKLYSHCFRLLVLLSLLSSYCYLICLRRQRQSHPASTPTNT